MGVHKKATNLAVNRDLGRTPYFIDTICSILKYFKRINMMDSNSLLAQTLETSKHIHESGKQSWYSGLVFILDELTRPHLSVKTYIDQSNMIKTYDKQMHVANCEYLLQLTLV